MNALAPLAAPIAPTAPAPRRARVSVRRNPADPGRFLWSASGPGWTAAGSAASQQHAWNAAFAEVRTRADVRTGAFPQ